MLRSVKAEYVSGNHYSLALPIYEVGLKFIHIFSATPGYSVQWFSNTDFSGTPFLQRVTPNLI